MSVETVKNFLQENRLINDYLEFTTSSATVELAAQAIGCEESQIAKSLALKTSSGPIVIVVMGSARIDNKKFKEIFKEKAKFLQGDEVLNYTGHPIGGVCPFGLKKDVKLYLDESLKIYDIIYPAAGACNNAVKISINDLEKITNADWVDVCK